MTTRHAGNVSQFLTHTKPCHGISIQTAIGCAAMKALHAYMSNIPSQHYAWYLFVIWAILTLPSLGLAPLFDYDETIYAQTAADMMHLGEWIVPTANGMQFFEKPPFTYYMMDVCFTIFGENAFAARLPSAIFTLFTALLLFRFGRDTHSPKFGIAAAFIFLSMLEVGILGHAAILDAVLNFFIAACLINYFRWIQKHQKEHMLWCAAMMGAAVSIKGPVGAVVPVLIMLLDRIMVGNLKQTLSNIPWLPALLLFFVCATPWYLMIWVQHGSSFLYEFIVVQNIGRAMNPMQGHGGGWHYYLVVFAISVLPWLMWMPMLIQRWKRQSSDTLDHLIRFSLLWSAVVLVLFSFAQTKLPHYISSLYPAIALAITAMWFQGKPNRIFALQIATSIILIPVAIALIAFPWIYPEMIHWVHHPRAIAVLSQPIQPSVWIAIGGIILLISNLYLWFKKDVSHALHRFIIIGFVLQSVLLIPLGSFAGKLAQAPQTRIAHAISQLPHDMNIYSYNLNFPSISFQAKRPYHIILNQKGRHILQTEKHSYGLILRAESLKDLPWLKELKPMVNQGGFLFYQVNP